MIHECAPIHFKPPKNEPRKRATSFKERTGLSTCYGLNCVPRPNPYIEALTYSVIVFGDGGLW